MSRHCKHGVIADMCNNPECCPLAAAKEKAQARRSAAACSAAPAVNLRNVLIVLAADMLMTDEIPSGIADDWDFSKSTTLRDKVKVIRYARRSREQCRKWALRLRDIADSLPNDQREGPPTETSDNTKK